jgi:hypothetical protein
MGGARRGVPLTAGVSGSIPPHAHWVALGKAKLARDERVSVACLVVELVGDHFAGCGEFDPLKLQQGPLHLEAASESAQVPI